MFITILPLQHKDKNVLRHLPLPPTQKTFITRAEEDRRSWNCEPPPYLTPQGWIWEDRRQQGERRLPQVEEIAA